MEKLLMKNICQQYQCSKCCNPVKISTRKIIDLKRDKLPFIELREVLIPEEHPDHVRLKSYSCRNFNSQTGLCDDYFNRPLICRNTECLAFKTTDRKKQIEIIQRIKAEKFIRITLDQKGELKCLIT